jgi:hypothetical protein
MFAPSNTNNMEVINENEEQSKRDLRCRPHQTRSGRMMGGLVVVGVGAVLLARQLGVLFPDWLFTWPMILIVVGIYVGAKHGFRRGGWLAPIVIGIIFISDDVFPDLHMAPLFWPIFIIVIGILIILKPRHRHNWKWDHHHHDNAYTESGEDSMETVSVFGGVKKNIISKDFKGGEITCVFGGAEINMSQADINGTVTLEVTCVLGGAKLIIPANWEVQSEMVAVMGGIEDKRPLQKDLVPSGKKLLIRGTTVFGGIEIKSY